MLVVCAVHAQFLGSWALWMWGRDHYQYFPLILGGFAWFVWQRLPLIRWPSGPAFSIRVAGYMLVSCGLFLLAARVDSHWLGLISCLVAVWASVWYVGGSAAADELRWPTAFLGLLIPLPLNLDLQAITGLQKAATWLASGALDLRFVRHTVSGVVLRTEARSFMVEEACSGIHSLFSAVTAMTFVAVYLRYGSVRILLTIVQTIFWVLAANAFRVFLIVYADSRWQLPLDTGWRHDALGLATYALVLIFALSTDQMLRFLFPIAHGAMLEAQREFVDVIVKPWRRFITNACDRPAIRGKAGIAIPLALLLLFYVPFCGLSLANQLRVRASTVIPDAAASAEIPRFTDNSLSNEIGTWHRVDFQFIDRNADDPFGMRSSVWRFAGSGMTAAVSVDGPYNEWHDLAYCYAGMGWKLVEGTNGETLLDQQSVAHTRLKLAKNSGESAVVYFSCFDSRNQPVKPPEATGNILRYLKNRLVSGGLTAESQQPVVPPVYQIQLMASSPRELMPHELDALESLFREARAVLHRQSSGER